MSNFNQDWNSSWYSFRFEISRMKIFARSSFCPSNSNSQAQIVNGRYSLKLGQSEMWTANAFSSTIKDHCYRDEFTCHIGTACFGWKMQFGEGGRNIPERMLNITYKMVFTGTKEFLLKWKNTLDHRVFVMSELLEAYIRMACWVFLLPGFEWDISCVEKFRWTR